jgi:hypothetical protein
MSSSTSTPPTRAEFDAQLDAILMLPAPTIVFSWTWLLATCTAR